MYVYAAVWAGWISVDMIADTGEHTQDAGTAEHDQDAGAEAAASMTSFGSELFSKVWSVCARVAEEEGVTLYDIDVPGAKGVKGVLRVYITRTVHDVSPSGVEVVERRSGISFDDCVNVTRKLLDFDEQAGVIPENCELEVSSPGINRRLRLPQHFQGAVGERVRCKFKNTAGTYEVVTGVLKECSDGVMQVESESGKKRVEVSIEQIKEARVDFRF